MNPTPPKKQNKMLYEVSHEINYDPIQAMTPVTWLRKLSLPMWKPSFISYAVGCKPISIASSTGISNYITIKPFLKNYIT